MFSPFADVNSLAPVMVLGAIEFVTVKTKLFAFPSFTQQLTVNGVPDGNPCANLKYKLVFVPPSWKVIV